ncbi:Co2+/Mg2+ efflux protein ApaG [Roseisolibacter sp. H3M3-2]|uniref:Co2+/Mg2+ efflux protein ApaG n=1 Tax=Roseisolibacter sp. H3M3-2 TaxID=3031323 RepID=UPI0023DC6E4D|nr:Co2+/Mg2+ efflux protein ApaG [Roseisolibacter sp. H3M3-2]MDF1502022.1 Co2+/Mg2+ efflux protein ApaG [Roseisolibacter sp. H3M3-2]
MPPRRPLFHRETEGIRVTVRPSYLREQSRPYAAQHVFAYHVRIENVGARSAQLLSRSWLIHDDAGEETKVDGEGVVGEQPVIAPGRVHEYRSFCVLKSTSGWMEGHYRFVRDDGTRFEAVIPRFLLDAADALPE